MNSIQSKSCGYVLNPCLSEAPASNSIADAWQPLNPDQKDRMRLAAMHVLHEVKGAVADLRHMDDGV
jgi:hypothetical protein